MKTTTKLALLALLSAFSLQPSGLLHAATMPAFEGRIQAVITQGSQTTPLLYTVGTNFLRIEVTDTNWPHPVNILDLNSGELTLLFPNNRSFVRLKSAVADTSATPVDQPQPPGAPAMPAMPVMPPPMREKIELRATDETTNLLGFPCARYVIKQRFEAMEIWATDKMPAFQPYVQRQPRRVGPHGVVEQWGDLLKAKGLLPLLVVLRFDNGAEQLRFEIKSVRPQKLTDEDTRLFQPPPGYIEIQPLPF